MNKKQTCLLIYLNNGNGFRAPAIAIQKVLEEQQVEVLCVDLLEYLGADKTRKLWVSGGDKALAHPWIDKLVYHVLTKFAPVGYELEYQLVKKKLSRLFASLKPDFVVSVHFVTNGILAKFLMRKGVAVPLFAYNSEVITYHKAYSQKAVYRYLSPTPLGTSGMIQCGVEEKTIASIPFPIDEKYLKKFGTQTDERKALGLEDMFTVLLSFGGAGLGSYELVEKLIEKDLPLQLVVVCGRNEEYVSRLQEMASKGKRIRIKPVGFISNMQDYLYCCDISAGKSGMNMTFESIYMKRPFLVTRHLENEKPNADLVKAQGFGWIAKDNDHIIEIIENNLHDQKELAAIRERMEKAPYDFRISGIAQTILQEVDLYHRLKSCRTLLFDLAGTLCDIPIEHIWEKVNQDGIRSVLALLDTEAELLNVDELIKKFVERKAVLRKEAKTSLREFEIQTQLQDFFSAERVSDSTLNAVLEKHPLTPELLRALEVAFVRPELDITIPFEGVKKVLTNLQKHYKLVLVSNNASHELVYEILRKLDIEDLFAHIYVSADIGWRKPSKHFLEPVLEELQESPETLCMIGDRLSQDIRMANYFAMTSIYFAARDHEDNKDVTEAFTGKAANLEELEYLLLARDSK